MAEHLSVDVDARVVRCTATDSSCRKLARCKLGTLYQEAVLEQRTTRIRRLGTGNRLLALVCALGSGKDVDALPVGEERTSPWRFRSRVGGNGVIVIVKRV